MNSMGTLYCPLQDTLTRWRRLHFVTKCNNAVLRGCIKTHISGSELAGRQAPARAITPTHDSASYSWTGTSSLPSKPAVFHPARTGRQCAGQGDGPLPLARDRAAVLASERENLQAVVPVVADEELFACHYHLTRIIEQQQTKPVAGLQRLGVEGDDLVQLEIALIAKYAEEQPAGREDRGVDIFVRIFVVRDLGSGVSEAAESLLTECGRVKELLASGDTANIANVARKLEAGAAAHVASEDAHRGSRPHYQLIAARYHRRAQRDFVEEILRKVERHLSQATPALAGCLPAVRPLRAHRGRRAVLQL
eukprot:scaffold36048_cov59-Phaeocystis_antarctica.AAC.8